MGTLFYSNSIDFSILLFILVNEAGADIPECYRNATLFDEWLQDGPIGLCLRPPRPHMFIQPFAYLQHGLKNECNVYYDLMSTT